MWVVGSVAAAVGLIVVVIALFSDAPPSPAPRTSLAPGLPRPAELRRARFPLAWRGYDPRAVDAHLAEVAGRYEALYLAAGPSAIARAEATLEGRPRDAAPPDVEPPESDAGQKGH